MTSRGRGLLFVVLLACAACGRLGYAQHEISQAASAAPADEAVEPKESDAETSDAAAAANDIEVSVSNVRDDAGGVPMEGDAGMLAPQDAGAMSGADAGAAASADAGPTSTPDASSTTCAGSIVFGLCWYLGAPGESCIDTCKSRGGTRPRAKAFVGTPSEGGSPEECQSILNALGYPAQVVVGYRDDGLGLGCHHWDDGVNWWLDSPAFDETSAGYPAQVVCACRE